LVGWRSLRMVERYTHLSPTHETAAVERISAGIPLDWPCIGPGSMADATQVR